jgi:hypothetical protein
VSLMSALTNCLVQSEAAVAVAASKQSIKAKLVGTGAWQLETPFQLLFCCPAPPAVCTLNLCTIIAAGLGHHTSHSSLCIIPHSLPICL